MIKITVEVESEEVAKVVERCLPNFLAFCQATYEEEQSRKNIPNQAAQPGCYQIH